MKWWYAAVIGVLSATELYTQSCCGGAGTFLGGMERGGLQPGMLTAAMVYNYTAMGRTLDGSQRIRDPYGRTAQAHALNAEVELSPVSGVSVLVVVPFADKSRWLNFTSGGATISQRYHANGVGDAFVLVKYSVLPPTLERVWSLAVGVGAKLPTGPSAVASNGVQLPPDVQPGNSAWEALGWLLGWYRWEEPAVSAAVSLLIRKPGATTSGRTPGTDIQTLVTLTTTELDFPLVPMLLSRLRWTDSDWQQGRPMPETGTFRVELLPAVALTLWEPLVVRLGGQVPLYERTNGIQLVPSWGAFAEVRTTLQLW